MAGGEDVKPKIQDGEVRQINVRVRKGDDADLQFKVKITTPLSKLITAFCKRTEIQEKAVKFLTPTGVIIKGEDTPAQLELEDGDIIDVHLNQTGGCLGEFVMGQ